LSAEALLAVAADEDVERVELKEGTLISGYSKAGTWATQWQGDKTVAYAFDSVDTAVVYDRWLCICTRFTCFTGTKVQILTQKEAVA
jgi:hypothetical protein